MNKRFDVPAQANEITKALKKGVFLTTKVGDKVNSISHITER